MSQSGISGKNFLDAGRLFFREVPVASRVEGVSSTEERVGFLWGAGVQVKGCPGR